MEIRGWEDVVRKSPSWDTDIPLKNRYPNINVQSNYSLINQGTYAHSPPSLSIHMLWESNGTLQILVTTSTLIRNPSSQMKGNLLILFFLFFLSPVTATSSQNS